MCGKEIAEVRKPLSAKTYGIVDQVIFLDLKESDDSNQVFSVKERVIPEIAVQYQISVIRLISVADMTISGFRNSLLPFCNNGYSITMQIFVAV